MNKIICLFNYSLPDSFINQRIELIRNEFPNYEFINLGWDTLLNDSIINMDHYDIVNHFYKKIKLIDNFEQFIFLGNGYGAKVLLDLKHRFKVSKQIYHGLFLSMNYIDPFLDGCSTYKYREKDIYKRIAKEINDIKLINIDYYTNWLFSNKNYIDAILKNLSIYDTLVLWKKYEPIQLINENISLTYSINDRMVSYPDSKRYIKKLNDVLSLNDVKYIDYFKHWPIIEDINWFIDDLKDKL